jgi:DNA primase
MPQKSHSSEILPYLSRPALEDLLRSVGVVVAGDTATDIIAYCPFHNNRDTPAFNISLSPPHFFRCHNGKCGAKGTIVTLLTKKGYSRGEAERMVKLGAVEISDLESVLRDILKPPKTEVSAEEWKEVDPHVFVEQDAANGHPAREYMLGRGITEEAIDHFGIGYVRKKDMAVVPVFDERSQLVGTIGREIQSKRYQYSTGLGRGQLVWNLNNSKEHEHIILTEGYLDAVYVWQAGWENVGAVLGSAISPKQWNLLRKYFYGIICFFDNDDAGWGLVEDVITKGTDLLVWFVEYPDRLITYTDDEGVEHQRSIKDPGELTADEINYMLENKKSSIDLLLEQ